jgi:NAD(P)-dependent dehydrogenase (short-subunit alcohol dehydrogenase family)
MSLAGQRIVVLGGTSGVGLATAQAAADAGAAVVVGSKRPERVARALAALPKTAQGHALDLASEEQIRGFFEQIGAFDHLVYTAGETLRLGELSDTGLDQARQFFDVRFWGALAAVKHASAHIRPGGSIVLSSGMAGRRPRKGWTVAASVCGAMDSLTRALAVELAPIRVNTVCPGLVRTELWDDMTEQARTQMYERAGGLLPVGRVGEPQDLAQAYLYAMREGFCTGQVIIVDGGASLV